MKQKLSVKDKIYMSICCISGAVVGAYFGAMTGEFYGGELFSKSNSQMDVIGIFAGSIIGIIAGVKFSGFIRECKDEEINFLINTGLVKGVILGVYSAVATHVVCILFTFSFGSFIIITLLIGVVVGAFAGAVAGLFLALLALGFGYYERKSQYFI